MSHHPAFTASQAVAQHALDVEPDAARRLLDSVRQIVRGQIVAAVADVYPVTITTREDGEHLIVEASAPNLVAEAADQISAGAHPNQHAGGHAVTLTLERLEEALALDALH